MTRDGDLAHSLFGEPEPQEIEVTPEDQRNLDLQSAYNTLVKEHSNLKEKYENLLNAHSELQHRLEKLEK